MDERPLDNKTNTAADAMEEAARKCTVGIVSGSGERKWPGIGTGTLIRWSGKPFILTAEHVIGSTLVEDLRFFLPHRNPPRKVDRDVLSRLSGVPSAILSSFSEVPIRNVARDQSRDLALLEVPEAIIEGRPATFFEFAPVGPGPQEGHSSLAIGFPFDISRVLEDDSRVVFMHTDWWPVEAPPTKRLENFDPTIHFASRFGARDTHPHANPSGMSGAARWSRKGDTPGVWHPNLDIIGVTVTYYAGSGILKMVRRDAVVRFLLERAG